MYDRPNLYELIDAARQHLEQNVIPVVKDVNHKLYFQTLVAANVLHIAQREMALGEGHQTAQWERLNALLGETLPLAATYSEREAAMQSRVTALCAAIRAGTHDEDAALFDHLMQTTHEQLEVANPKFLQALVREET